MKPLTHLTTLLFAFSCAFTSACDRPYSEQTYVITAQDADPQAYEETASKKLETPREPLTPALKSSEALDAVLAVRKVASANDRAYFYTERLSKWMDEMSVGLDPYSSDIPRLSEKQFQALTAKEVIGYYLFHPEWWNQNCNIHIENAGPHGVIRSAPPVVSTDNFPSDRQVKSIEDNLNGVSVQVLAALNLNGTVSVKLMRFIVEFELKVAVKPLIQIYETQSVKDDLILSTLIALMHRGKYLPWEKSTLAIVMDGKGFLPFDDLNARAIITFARRFAAS